MRYRLIACFLLVVMCAAKAKPETETEKPEITKLEVLDLGEGDGDVDAKDTDVQRKRDSGYSYKRPDRFTVSTRARLQVGQSGNRGRIVNRHPSQINRPVGKYGPPGYQNSPLSRPGAHGQQHRDKLQHQGHFNQQHSSNFDGRPGGLFQQEVPSPIRHFDFSEPNPIASQNNEPFAPNSANYLPPQNQKLPVYTQSHDFSTEQPAQHSLTHEQSSNFQSQSLVQSQGEDISDAALFLAQNAQAIQQLYGAPATEQDFAPNSDQFLGHTNQVQNLNAQFQQFDSSSQRPQGFSGPLPSYASGTLSPQETLEHIQSLEKDRLIVQLQRALASQTQAQNADAAGRYAENQASFVQSQDLLASLGQQMKIHGLNTQQSSVNLGAGNTAFNQSPFLPGTTISTPGFPLNYGLSTTTQTPTTTTTTTTPGTTTVQFNPGTKGDGSTQVGTTLSSPSQPVAPSASGFPIYGGFVPLIAGTGFVSNIPTYGPTYLTPSVIQSGSSPTHFGLPIPTVPNQKPAGVPTTPASAPTPGRPASSPPVNNVPVRPVAPVHPVTPLHPITPVHPVTPLHPVAPVHPVQTPSAHPTYGVQTSVVNSLLYKPLKPVYPFYYYPNVAYQLQRPSFPWSYAPSYQTKPAQIWK